jgi:S1-C subfamily serine protease
MRYLLIAVLAPVLFGCASAGKPASGFLNASIRAAYLPLSGSAYVVLEGHGAGVVIAPGIAVTDAHNANLVDARDVIGISTEYDLMFFRTRKAASLPQAAPRPGERVIAYGQGTNDGLRMATGVVRTLDAPVLPNCPTCHIQKAFTYEADAGKGFSGGPVVDATTGALVGITFGFRDVGKTRLMYAYDRSMQSQARK